MGASSGEATLGSDGGEGGEEGVGALAGMGKTGMSIFLKDRLYLQSGPSTSARLLLVTRCFIFC